MLANKCPKCERVTTTYTYERFCNACKFSTGEQVVLQKVEVA